MTRQLILQILFLVTASVAAAALIAYGLQELLPYDSLGHSTPEEQFFLWEAAMWLLGLLMLFFGVAAALGSLDLGRMRIPGLEEVHPSRNSRRRELTFSPLPWWVVATGLLLIALAARARGALDA